jgi:hypothetical protein
MPEPRASAVQGRYYTDRRALCRAAARFLAEGLRTTDLAVIIARPQHAPIIVETLEAESFAVEALQRDGFVKIVDPRETLDRFMKNGTPDEAAFGRVMTRLIEDLRRASGRRGAQVRIYSEMIDILWQDGRGSDAVRLETWWNRLSATEDFRLLFAYSLGHFYYDPAPATDDRGS